MKPEERDDNRLGAIVDYVRRFDPGGLEDWAEQTRARLAGVDRPPKQSALREALALKTIGG